MYGKGVKTILKSDSSFISSTNGPRSNKSKLRIVFILCRHIYCKFQSPQPNKCHHITNIERTNSKNVSVMLILLHHANPTKSVSRITII